MQGAAVAAPDRIDVASSRLTRCGDERTRMAPVTCRAAQADLRHREGVAFRETERLDFGRGARSGR